MRCDSQAVVLDLHQCLSVVLVIVLVRLPLED